MATVVIYDSEEKNPTTLELATGFALADTTGAIKFGCRAAACGKCSMTVLSGMENLNLPNPKEARGLTLFGRNLPNVRLACQLRVFGDCALKLNGVSK